MNVIPGKFSLYNKHGNRMCDAYGCRKNKRLVVQCHGLFCFIHAKEINTIRSQIHHENTWNEFYARLEELRFRKTFHFPHAEYAAFLEHQLMYP